MVVLFVDNVNIFFLIFILAIKESVVMEQTDNQCRNNDNNNNNNQIEFVNNNNINNNNN